ncbi:RNA polymerase sigma factor [Luteibaculum oceani]|uniref:RNA polymerase sigma factor n=1 Tax=Luteibaculum oceani TaxID=1294296 RepID=A0A5C6VJV8_9FLAO|nr:RNA polymerase sigma factor [Luteibaculum oceani]TXC85189.1 RNA polymerase sigma factor [Luteibaculum oceani]
MVLAEYNQCVDAYADKAYRFALKLCGNREMASNVVKAAFAHLWSIKEGLAPKEVKKTLFKTCYSQLVLKRVGESNSSAVNTSTPPDGNSLTYLVDKGLGNLPAKQKAILMLRDYEGFSYEEISMITEMDIIQVKSLMYRSRKALKSYIVKNRFSV